jgi:hypothetical protein
MWIGMEVTGSIYDKFEVICGLEKMIWEDVMTKFDVIFE